MQSYLYVLAVINVWINVGCDEVGVVGEPTHNKNDHYHYHHLYNLDKWNFITIHNKDWKQKNKGVGTGIPSPKDAKSPKPPLYVIGNDSKQKAVQMHD